MKCTYLFIQKYSLSSAAFQGSDGDHLTCIRAGNSIIGPSEDHLQRGHQYFFVREFTVCCSTVLRGHGAQDLDKCDYHIEKNM